MELKKYIFVFFMMYSACVMADGDEILGIWLDDAKEGQTRFFKCTDGSYAAKIVWLLVDKDENGNPILDKRNPDKEKRTNTLIGSIIMKGIRYVADEDKWTLPYAYDPKIGMSGAGYIRIVDGEIILKASKFGITKTRIMTRVE